MLQNLKKKGLARSFEQKNLKRPTLILSLGGYIIFGTGLPSILWFVVVLNTISLSMWSKYSNSIREKKPWTIRKNFGCVKKYLIKFLSNFSSIREKIQTPWTIQFYVVKNTSMKIFLWSKKHKFLDLAMFSKNGYYLDSSRRLVFFTDTILGHRKMKNG